MMRSLLLLPLLLLLASTSANDDYERVDDELRVVARLGSSSLFAAARAQSTSRLLWTAAAAGGGGGLPQHSGVLPRDVLDAMGTTGAVKEVGVSLSAGVWDEAEWGAPLLAVPSGGGAEMWAWIEHSEKENESEWNRLTNAFSGLFCVSLSEINDGNSVILDYARNNTRLHYGTLPSESACTENLSPFLSLLPCRNRAGLGKMFHPLVYFRSEYTAMSLHVRFIKMNVSSSTTKPWWSQDYSDLVGIEISQSIVMVRKVGGYSFRLSDFFEVPLSRCPMAHTSSIFIETSKEDILTFDHSNNKTSSHQDQIQVDLSPFPHRLLDPSSSSHYKIAQYSLQGDCRFQDGCIVDKKEPLPSVSDVQITFLFDPISLFKRKREEAKLGISHQRYLTGFGDRRGGVASILRSNEGKEVTLFEIIPAFLMFRLGSLRIRIVTELEGKTIEREMSKAEILSVITDFVPAMSIRGVPTLLRFDISIPSSSSILIHYEFDKALLSVEEHPPDPNRGYDIPSSIIRVRPLSLSLSSPHEDPQLTDLFGLKETIIFTDTLLVTLPLPDFSMLFNVITLTSTLLAFALGSAINVTTRARLSKPASATTPSRFKISCVIS